MFPFIQVGPLSLQSRGLILILTAWIASTVFEHAAPQSGIKREEASSLSFLAFIVLIVAARIGYIMQYLPVYLSMPQAALALDANTLSWPIGLAAMVAVCYGRIRRRHLSLLGVLDALAMGLPFIAAGLALANLASGDGYGAPAQLPWSITLWGASRQPTQIYELIAAVGIGIIIWRIKPTREGQRFSIFVALYAGSRLFLEGFHGDSTITWGGVRTVQLWSLVILIIAVLLTRRLGQRASPPHSTGER